LDIYDFYNTRGIVKFDFQKLLQDFKEFGNHTQLDGYNLINKKDKEKICSNFFHTETLWVLKLISDEKQ